MAIPRLENKNHARRYGANCAECGKKLGHFRIDGSIGGKRVGFCSFNCQDTYSDKVEARRAVAGEGEAS